MIDCRYQHRVAEAARTSDWNRSLREHRDQCATCAEAALVTAALITETASDDSPLPDARRVWIMARQGARRHAAQRAVWPITVAHRIAWIVLAALAIAWAPQVLDLLRTGLSVMVPANASTVLMDAATSPGAVLVATAVFLGGMIAVEAAVRDSS